MAEEKKPRVVLKKVSDALTNPSNGIPVNGFRSITVPISSLIPYSKHFFSVVDDESMRFLAESIDRDGLQTPLLVRPNGEKYEIISGHRRKRASEIVGLKEVPVFVADFSDEEAEDLMISTNFHRLDLKPSERARMYQHALDSRNHRGKKADSSSIEDVTKIFEKSDKTIRRYTSLLKLEPEVLAKVDDGVIPLSKAFELAKSLTKKSVVPSASSKTNTPKAHKITLLLAEIEQYLPGPMNDSEIKEYIIQQLKDCNEVDKTKK